MIASSSASFFLNICLRFFYIYAYGSSGSTKTFLKYAKQALMETILCTYYAHYIVSPIHGNTDDFRSQKSVNRANYQYQPNKRVLEEDN